MDTGKEVVYFSANIALIFFNRRAHSGSFMCLKKVAALLERRNCRGRILSVTIYNLKRKGTDPHPKGQELEKGEEHQEGYEKEVKDAEGATYEAGGF